jgi:hypothetical protein
VSGFVIAAIARGRRDEPDTPADSRLTIDVAIGVAATAVTLFTALQAGIADAAGAPHR